MRRSQAPWPRALARWSDGEAYGERPSSRGGTMQFRSSARRGSSPRGMAERSSRGIRTKYYLPGYSSGSSLMMLPWWLLPTQKVTGVVELSTNTRRTLVDIGNR